MKVEYLRSYLETEKSYANLICRSDLITDSWSCCSPDRCIRGG